LPAAKTNKSEKSKKSKNTSIAKPKASANTSAKHKARKPKAAVDQALIKNKRAPPNGPLYQAFGDFMSSWTGSRTDGLKAWKLSDIRAAAIAGCTEVKRRRYL
jgi:hypothetical protein